MTLFSTATGPIGQDAETRDAGSSKVTSFSVATKHWDNKKKENVTQWVTCSLWGDRGEKLREHLKKGQWVSVHGEQTIREYEHNGRQRHSVELDATRVVLCGKPRDEKKPDPYSGPSDNTNMDGDDSLPF